MTASIRSVASSEIDAFGRRVRVSVARADILEAEVDALAFKYAQAPYGGDRAALFRLGIPDADPRLPGRGDVLRVDTRGSLKTRQAIFLGTVPLQYFDYAEIREWTRRAIAASRDGITRVSHLGMTMHGVGVGLDEEEAFTAQLAGALDSIRRHEWPDELNCLTFFELDAKRAERLGRVLHQLLPGGPAGQGSALTRAPVLGGPQIGIDSAGIGSREKPHVFVAMQFGEATDDLFHYGIQSAVKAAGFLCERIDSVAFTGDILTQIKSKIDTASYVVAELTGANPNVYLEVGYAWGRNIRTILLCKAASELRFDVQGQKCLVYGSIRQLEISLAAELERLARSK